MRSEEGCWAAHLSHSALSSYPPGFSADVLGKRERKREGQPLAEGDLVPWSCDGCCHITGDITEGH